MKHFSLWKPIYQALSMIPFFGRRASPQCERAGSGTMGFAVVDFGWGRG